MPTPGRPGPVSSVHCAPVGSAPVRSATVHSAGTAAAGASGSAPDSRRRSDLALMRTWQRVRATMDDVDRRLACTVAAADTPAAVVHEALAAIAAASRRMLSIPDLATELGLTTTGTTRLVDALVEAEFVCRRRAGTDRRVVFAELTETGAAHERVSTRQYAEQLRIEMSVLGPARMAQLRDVASALSAWTTEDLATDPEPGTPSPAIGLATIEWGAG